MHSRPPDNRRELWAVELDTPIAKSDFVPEVIW